MSWYAASQDRNHIRRHVDEWNNLTQWRHLMTGQHVGDDDFKITDGDLETLLQRLDYTQEYFQSTGIFRRDVSILHTADAARMLAAYLGLRYTMRGYEYYSFADTNPLVTAAADALNRVPLGDFNFDPEDRFRIDHFWDMSDFSMRIRLFDRGVAPTPGTFWRWKYWNAAIAARNVPWRPLYPWHESEMTFLNAAVLRSLNNTPLNEEEAAAVLIAADSKARAYWLFGD